MKTLILGGYGNFGARIARALARHDGIELLIAGRDAARAAALAASLGPDARAHALDDLNEDLVHLPRQLDLTLRPD